MKILHVNGTDMKGARFNGFSMVQKAKESTGTTIEMAVWRKDSNHPNVHEMRKGILIVIYAIFNRINRFFGLEGLLSPVLFILPFYKYFRKAEVIHLQMIPNGTIFSVLALPLLCAIRPIVWTVHDAWPTTGMCIHSFDCEKWLSGCKGYCPYPRGESIFRHYTPSVLWRIKKFIFKRIQMRLIVASQWTVDRVKQSPLLNHFECTLIPFGVDLSVFTPKSKSECRKKLGIGETEHVILFRGETIKTDLYKGVRWIYEAMEIYDPVKPTTLFILNKGDDFIKLSAKYKIVNVDWINNENDLATIYSAADVFLMPSIVESFGMMAIEAMACGVPLIVFDGTPLTEIIQSPRGGLSVPAKDSKGLAGAVKRLLDDSSLRESMGDEARKIVEQRYAFDDYYKRHLELYSEVHKGKGE